MHAMPSNFWEWLSSTNMSSNQQSDLLMTTIVIFASILLLIVAMISFTIYKIHRNRLTDSLKRELLERGMSAEDIVEIVRATPARSCGRRDY